jgi:hypothetical protein
MPLPGAPRTLTASVAALAILVVSRDAAAGGAKWYVDAESSCDAEPGAVESLEREIGLACAAVGGTCRVVAAPDDAELRATLACNDDSWSLETRTIEGSPLNKIELGGPSEDRLREAAVEIARDVAPERSLVIDSLKDALPGDDRGSRERASPSVFAIAASGRGTVASDGAPATGGARVIGGFRVGALTHWTLSGAYEGGGRGDRTRRDIHVGTGVAIGAPLVEGPLGFVVEGGAIIDEGHVVEPSPGRWGLQAYPATRVGAYGQTTFFVQVPRGPARPYAGISAAAMTISPSLSASAELGVAFAVF